MFLALVEELRAMTRQMVGTDTPGQLGAPIPYWLNLQLFELAMIRQAIFFEKGGRHKTMPAFGREKLLVTFRPQIRVSSDQAVIDSMGFDVEPGSAIQFSQSTVVVLMAVADQHKIQVIGLQADGLQHGNQFSPLPSAA